jgi:hypothetical protein
VALIGLALAALVGALGWPAERAPAAWVACAAALATGTGWAIAYNVNRWVHAQEHGVYRVRSVQ